MNNIINPNEIAYTNAKKKNYKNVTKLIYSYDNKLSHNKEIKSFYNNESKLSHKIKNETIYQNADEMAYRVMEEVEKYELINTPHDKSIRSALANKREAIIFLNRELGLKEGIKLEEKDIEKYKSRFVTAEYKNKESDLIYKIHKKEIADGEIYVIIEHQTKIDYAMPFRVTEYEMQLMKEIIDYKKLRNKDYKIPYIMTIVLYTGEQKWNAEQTIETKQVPLLGFKKNIKLGEYELIETNNYTEEELLKQEGIFSKIIMLEKIQEPEELEEAYKKILRKEITEEERKILYLYTANITKMALGDEETKAILEKINKDGGEERMYQLAETIKRELKQNRKEGMKQGEKKGKVIGFQEGKIATAKAMLENGIEIEKIKKITGLSEEEILK